MTPVHESKKSGADLVAALLAGEVRLPEAELARICAEEREALSRDAAVTAYLDIFVVRNVQQRLRSLALTANA